jgi:hypothetical protein
MSLVDFGALPDGSCDHVLEYLHKALADPPAATTIWQPHHDPLISGTIETFTARGSTLLDKLRRELLTQIRELDGLTKAEWAVDVTRLESAIRQLKTRPARQWSIDDWLVYLDWLIHRYLPPGVIRTEADYLTVRAAVAAKIRANMPGAVPAPGHEVRLPVSAAAASVYLRFTEMERFVLDVARARAAESITHIGDETRHRLKTLIINHLQARTTGDPGATTRALEAAMFDEFSILNRDWRRVAITETVNAHNEGIIAAMPPGSRVRRFEMYEGACPFCRKINGMEFEVVDPARADKDGWKHVWVGKTNVGRSASPRKRGFDGELVERTEAELWWPAAGAQHPHCRGGWEPIVSTAAPLDPRSKAYLEQLLAKHGISS